MAHRRSAVRLGLVGVAAPQLAPALPGLGGPSTRGSEAASWSVAAAFGLFMAAASPRRVLGILPVLSAVALVLVTVRDLVDGDVHIGHDLPHGLLISGVRLLWLLRDRGCRAPLRGEEDLARQPARPGTRGTSRERYLIRRW